MQCCSLRISVPFIPEILFFIGSVIPGTDVIPSTSFELADNSKQILGISLGVALFGVAVVILSIVVVVFLVVMRTKRKSLCNKHYICLESC